MVFNASYLKRVLGNVFQLSETSINNYDISFMYKLPWYNWNIVECGIKHHNSNPLFLITGKHCPILFSNSWRTQYILEQWVFFETSLNYRRILKLNYVGNIIEWVGLNISIFLPRAGTSLYISVTIDFQISFSWYVLYSISLSAQVYVQIQSDETQAQPTEPAV
jgi:hypothetical protein